MDLPRFAEIGKSGVKLFLCESTNVEKPGVTPSEKTVGQTFDEIFNRHPKERLVIATFSSNVHRVQQIIDNLYCNESYKLNVSRYTRFKV